MLGMFLLTGIMLFSTAIYFFERGMQSSRSHSIFPNLKQCHCRGTQLEVLLHTLCVVVV